MIAKKKRPAARPGAEYLTAFGKLCGKNKSSAPPDLSKPARGDRDRLNDAVARIHAAAVASGVL